MAPTGVEKEEARQLPMESDSASSCSQCSQSVTLPQQSQLDCQHQADIRQAEQNRSFAIQMKEGQNIRNYQHELASPGINGENYIIFAPTNSGKTLVAALVIASHLERNTRQRKSPKVVMVVKTRLLADQQTKRLKEYIPGARVECSRGIESENTDNSSQLPSVKEALAHSDIIVCTAGKLVDGFKKGNVAMQDFSLLVMDECHNTDKGSNYAQIMHVYLEQKVDRECQPLLPQVVGLTATPGVGKNPGLNWDREIDKLLTLCAHMDATSGIKSVQQYIEELNRVVPKSKYEKEVVEQSEKRHMFIRRVEQDMMECEAFLNFKLDSNSPRWSQCYEQTVKEMRNSLEESDNPENRNKISSIRMLEFLAQTLMSYIDLPYDLALASLEEYDEFNIPDNLISDHDKQLQKMRAQLKCDISSLPTCENPILEKVIQRLAKTFQQNPKSEGIIFVRTREQAEAISNWISNSKFAKDIGVMPHMLLGHKRQEENGPSMSDSEQKAVLEAFHSGVCNLLVATSVAEEGLDIKRCNLVMRLHVSSARSKAQMKGRARAEDSEIVTIVSDDPKKLYKDMLNDEQLLLTERTIQHILPLHYGHFLQKIPNKQIEIVDKLKMQREADKLRVIRHPAQDVVLKCKKCTVVACHGSDLYVIDNTNHCVVPGDVLRYETVEHHKPGIICSYNETSVIKKDYKVHCCTCGTSWGVLGTWPTGKEFPVLKCECFNFFINGIQVTFRQWKKRPFEILPLSKWFAESNSQV